MRLRLLVHHAIMGAFALSFPQSSKMPATTGQFSPKTKRFISSLKRSHSLAFLLELWVLCRGLSSVHLYCIAYCSWAVYIDRSPSLLVPGSRYLRDTSFRTFWMIAFFGIV
ncbi:hypothetical protein V8E52_011600 [Russula decolorans]